MGKQPLRLGILGGTFDPIHLGHLRMGEEICEDLELDKVMLIPGAFPPHKDGNRVTPFKDRFFMAKTAVKNSSRLEVLDLEAQREGPSYSIETIREIHLLYKSDSKLFFIIGMDAFLDIKTWREYKELFYASNFVVLKRPGFSFEDLGPFVVSLGVGFKNIDNNYYSNPSGNTLIYKDVTLLDISSTKIRELVIQKKSIRFLVPEVVRHYIAEKGLYITNENSG